MSDEGESKEELVDRVRSEVFWYQQSPEIIGVQPVAEPPYRLRHLFAQLDRAAMNQVEGGESVFPRYADWAENGRNHLAEAISCLDRGEVEAAREIIFAMANTLGAFAAVQRMTAPFLKREMKP